MNVLIISSPNIIGRGGQVRSYYVLKHLSRTPIENYVVTIDTPHHIVNELRNSGVNIINNISCNGSEINTCIAKLVRNIIKHITDLRIDMVVSHSEHPLFVLPTFISSALSNIPWTVIVQSHMYINPYLSYGRHISITRFLRTMLALRAMNSTLVHLVSDVIQHELSRLGIGFRNYEVLEIPVGLDHELMKLCLNANQPKVYDLAFMGALTVEKGIYDLLYIVSKIAREYRQVKLLLLGDFNSPYERERFMDLTKRLGIEEMVIYAGYRIGMEKYCELSKARVFLFPSYVDALPISVLEALGMGLPVITWDLPYANQFRTNAVIKVRSRRDFVDKVITLLKDQAYMERLSKEARSFVMQYTWDAAAHSEYKAYIKTLSWWYKRS